MHTDAVSRLCTCMGCVWGGGGRRSGVSTPCRMTGVTLHSGRRARLGMTLEPLLGSTALYRADVSGNTSSELSSGAHRNEEHRRRGGLGRDLGMRPHHEPEDSRCKLLTLQLYRAAVTCSGGGGWTPPPTGYEPLDLTAVGYSCNVQRGGRSKGLQPVGGGGFITTHQPPGFFFRRNRGGF